MSKALVIGAGAIGGFYGALLARQGVEVSVVCRSEYDHVKTHGFKIISHNLGNWHFYPAQVLARVEDYQDRADYVLLCTKIVAGLDRPALAAPALTEQTALLFIQNGVEIEAEMATAFPEHEIISGLAFICCSRTAPGVINNSDYGHLTIGSVSPGRDIKTRQLAALFTGAGIDCTVSDDIERARWQKCVWNAPFSPLSVLSGGLTTEKILAQEALVKSIMTEVCAIAAALGKALPADIIQTNIENTYTMPPYKTSMLFDYLAGRPMETETILGNAVRAGRRVAVDTPHLETIYALMKLRELALVQSRSD